MRRVLLPLLFLLSLSACHRGQEPLPTPADPVAEATALALTQNAPPPGFQTAAFPQIDANLTLLAGWRYTVLLTFDGVYARTPRQTSSRTEAQVWFNQLGAARRVVVTTQGELLGLERLQTLEGVRLGQDAFLLRDGACLTNADADAALTADLRAGELIGGVTLATPTGRRATMNGVPSYEYAFTPDVLNLPNLRLADGGRITSMSGEVWVAPELNAVVRFYVTMAVDNAVFFDRPLPVSGTVLIRYDLFDVGVLPNISVPFGC